MPRAPDGKCFRPELFAGIIHKKQTDNLSKRENLKRLLTLSDKALYCNCHLSDIKQKELLNTFYEVIFVKDISIQELKNTAVQMRMKVIDMIYKAQSGHPGGSLSAADFVTACYFKYMNVDPKNPRWPDRDRMVLSKGHVCPIQYACLASVGFFPEAELDTLRKEGSMLQGHPSMNKCPGICLLYTSDAADE